ncbi:MAG TPA: hypothetical protein VH437_13000 [Terriglobales bacterium]|jgi:hypothetical protein
MEDQRRLKNLEKELESIRAHNRIYAARRFHSPLERQVHDDLQGKAAEIMVELARLRRQMNKAA